MGILRRSVLPRAYLQAFDHVCQAHLLQHPLFRLSHVVGSASTAGKRFEEVWIDKEEALASHYGKNMWADMLVWGRQPMNTFFLAQVGRFGLQHHFQTVSRGN